MGDDSGEKTEEPTPHKLREARRKGQVAKSKDLTAAFLLLVSFYSLKFSATRLWEKMSGLNTYIFSAIGQPFSGSLVGKLLWDSMMTFLSAMAPIFGAIFLTAIVLESIQTGFLISSDPLTPKLEKLNPIEGVKKFFSLKQYVELLKSVLKMIVVVALFVSVVKNEITMIVIAQQLTLWQMMAYVGSLVMKLIVRIGIFYLIIAILDYLYQRYEYIKGLRMSKKEIKDEYKRLEGDPLVKQRQKDAAREMLQARQMGAVPDADVVVTNPTHVAVAIKYKMNEMPAPKVLAKGKELIAQEIRRLADEHQIPIIENPPVARKIFENVEVDRYLPEEYYRAIAEILAFVYNLKKKRKLGR